MDVCQWNPNSIIFWLQANIHIQKRDINNKKLCKLV